MKRFELFIPWLIACLSTIGSLFFSELQHKAPCSLCWYQRIIMFPLAIILGIAAFRNAYRIIVYVLPLSLIGLGIATYHVIMIKLFHQITFCAECTLKPISSNPIVAFPTLSFTAFILLNASLIWIYWKHRNSKKL